MLLFDTIPPMSAMEYISLMYIPSFRDAIWCDAAETIGRAAI